MKERDHIIEDIEKWPISQFYQDREAKVQMLSDVLTKYMIDNHSEAELIDIVNRTVYLEKLRVRTDPLNVDPPKEITYWKNMESELSKDQLSDDLSQQLHDKVRRISNRYAEEIVGDFRPKTFMFARKALTLLFGSIFNPFFAHNKKGFWGGKEAVLDKFKIVGPVDHIRKLFTKGSVLILPTHSSNLDSILVGYAIETLTGLPAFSYGAGLNLYDYELMAYYMSRLGAYKVDRRKKNPIYAQAIRQFSRLSIEQNLNSIFFPGGTRSRGGEIESKVKLGLLSTLLEAQNDFYRHNYDNKIIIVPLVISYHSVLEASSLIEQHLKKVGKQNYLSTKKQSKSSFKRIRFLRRLLGRGSNVTLSFGAPIDVFGHRLDEDGNSIKKGRMIDIKEYYQNNGAVSSDKQRNLVYTRNLGDELVRSYYQANVVLTSQLITFVSFRLFCKHFIDIDLLNLVNMPVDLFELEEHEVYVQITTVLDRLKVLRDQGKVKLSQELDTLKIEDIVKDGLKNLNIYHLRMPLYIKNGMFRSEDIKVLYFYANRLSGYDLDRFIHNRSKSVRSLKMTVDLM